MVFKKTLICYGILIVLSHFSHSVLCAELVGILPLSNQRYQKQDDWLGFYIQARIKANLGSNSDWMFHSQSVLKLWVLRPDRSLPISPLNTILIDGSFQQVGRLGHISLKVKRYLPKNEIAKEFDISFSADDLDNQIDHLSTKVGIWIWPDFRLENRSIFPVQNWPGMKEIFQLRQQMFQRGGDPPDIRSILYLEELINENSPDEMIADLTEAMVILSQFIQAKERKQLLNRTIAFLKKAILNNKKSARLYSLLAEAYYLNNNYASWITKTAADAIRLDAQNDLGYILKIIVNDLDAEAMAEDIEHLKQVNPWLFIQTIDSGVLFQNGILKHELSLLENPIK